MAMPVWSPAVVEKATTLWETAAPERTASPNGWRVPSSEVGIHWSVHTDADKATGTVTYADCSCPAGMKGARDNERISGCSHVLAVLMAVGYAHPSD